MLSLLHLMSSFGTADPSSDAIMGEACALGMPFYFKCPLFCSVRSQIHHKFLVLLYQFITIDFSQQAV
uniref:Uncharacterized protein n=1 Tax=Rhizophora mucronata TaxID=61149 RepID=A0A2P2MY25_RHIMU